MSLSTTSESEELAQRDYNRAVSTMRDALRWCDEQWENAVRDFPCREFLGNTERRVAYEAMREGYAAMRNTIESVHAADVARMLDRLNNLPQTEATENWLTRKLKKITGKDDTYIVSCVQMTKGGHPVDTYDVAVKPQKLGRWIDESDTAETLVVYSEGKFVTYPLTYRQRRFNDRAEALAWFDSLVASIE